MRFYFDYAYFDLNVDFDFASLFDSVYFVCGCYFVFAPRGDFVALLFAPSYCCFQRFDVDAVDYLSNGFFDQKPNHSRPIQSADPQQKKLQFPLYV